MQTLNALLELTLVVAVFFYFAGFIAPPPFRWRLWRWAVGLVAAVFMIALVVVEVRAHPIAASCIAAGTSLIAYGALRIRQEYRERGHRRPAPTPFLNLRVTGKTAVDLEDEAPVTEHEEHE
jgi:hypothetical protein